MALGIPFQETVKSKPLFVTIYATVIIGIFFSSFYVLSAIYSSNSPDATISISNPLSRGNSLTKAPTSSPSTGLSNVSVSPINPHSIVLKPIWEPPSKNKKMPSLESFRLTKALVEKRVKDNVIIVTFGNYAFMDFILTWVKHLTDLGLSNILVGAMDTKLLEALYWKGIPVFDMGSHMSTVDVGWGSPTFHKMGREKNPLPYFARFPGADVLTSTDQVVPTVVDDRLDLWQEVTGAYNIGIFHWRPTVASRKLAKKWKELLLADEKTWDQNGFNDIVRTQIGPPVNDESGLVYAYDGNLKLGFLPASIFCSGHTYFVQAMYQQFKLQPYAVHTTFQYAGTEGKRHRLREAMLFYDPPDYYNSPGGFLSFTPSIPRSLLFDGEHNVESHFAVVNYQMKQIRTALAIASLLKRTLVRTD